MNWKRPGGGPAQRGREATNTMPARSTNNPVEPRLVAPTPAMPRSLLGADTVVTGRLSFNAPTRIDGTLRGEVRATELLVIGEDGFVDGTVRAQKLVVLGKMRGDVRGAEQVEIGPGGRLTGTIETRSLVVQEGGQLDGDCRIQPGRSNVVELHPASIVTGDA
ncbi:MAG TPA: polymer-forming cytoskeletal protein [Candidatus Binatia bacterium]|nr:polymer-forming cytoskeletal protein [Candidatus Binatia bacterium]